MGPQIWNCLPNELKSADNLSSFKQMIKQWDGPSCKCNVCKYEENDIYPVNFMSNFQVVLTFS